MLEQYELRRRSKVDAVTGMPHNVFMVEDAIEIEVEHRLAASTQHLHVSSQSFRSAHHQDASARLAHGRPILAVDCNT